MLNSSLSIYMCNHYATLHFYITTPHISQLLKVNIDSLNCNHTNTLFQLRITHIHNLYIASHPTMQNPPYYNPVFTLCLVIHSLLLIGQLTSFLMKLTLTLKVPNHAYNKITKNQTLEFPHFTLTLVLIPNYPLQFLCNYHLISILTYTLE